MQSVRKSRPKTAHPRHMSTPRSKSKSHSATNITRNKKMSLVTSFDFGDYGQSIVTSSEDEEPAVSASLMMSESGPTTRPESEAEEEGRSALDTLSQNDAEKAQIAKLLKYAHIGNLTATVLALVSLQDLGLHTEFKQLAVLELEGVRILLNILETDDTKCKIAALQVLRDVAEHVDVRKAIFDYLGIQPIVELLYDMNSDLRALAADVMAKTALDRKCRLGFRKANAIPRLVDMMDVDHAELTVLKEDQVVPSHLPEVRAAAEAILSLCQSKSNRYYILKSGGILVIAKLMKTRNYQLMLPTIGIVQECAVENEYVVAIRTLGMFEPIVKLLMTPGAPATLKERCARAIGKCSLEPISRDTLREAGAIDALVKLLRTSAASNMSLLSAVTAALWQCSTSQGNVEKIEALNGIEALVHLIDPTAVATATAGESGTSASGESQQQSPDPGSTPIGQHISSGRQEYPADVVCAAVGALAECASRGGQQAHARKALRSSGGLAALLRLLSSTTPSLLVNSAKAIGACAQDPLALALITKMDGIRLLWSLLKHKDASVQASAAWSICHCLQKLENSGELVRSFVGGLELLVTLVQSDNLEVVSSICATVAVIAEDRENLAVLTDHGVVPILAKLAKVGSTNDCLRESLAEAIANCADYQQNQAVFGENGAVVPLVAYFVHSTSPAVHTATTKALEQLSKDPDNCITMHQHGVVKYLLRLCGSFESSVQESAANCLRNIRKVALATAGKPVP